jgi:hypothetical protein
MNPLAGKVGVVPPFHVRSKAVLGLQKLSRVAGKLAMRGMALGLVTPAAAEVNPASRGLLTSAPEPANLIVMGLALAVLFLFRRFSKIS